MCFDDLKLLETVAVLEWVCYPAGRNDHSTPAPWCFELSLVGDQLYYYPALLEDHK